MLPLIWILLAWIILVAIFASMAAVTVVVCLRYGLSGLGTTLSAAIFLIVSVLIIVGSGMYLLGVDWNDGLAIWQSAAPSLFP